MKSELKLIENELVPVYETDRGNKVVYGSDLHAVLQVKSRYREWVERRFIDCDAVKSVDFEEVTILAPSGQTRKEHIILLDTAKEMAMLERNERGKQVRRYFIEVEKRYKELAMKRDRDNLVELALVEAKKLLKEYNLRYEGKVINAAY